MSKETVRQIAGQTDRLTHGVLFLTDEHNELHSSVAEHRQALIQSIDEFPQHVPLIPLRENPHHLHRHI